MSSNNDSNNIENISNTQISSTIGNLSLNETSKSISTAALDDNSKLNGSAVLFNGHSNDELSNKLNEQSNEELITLINDTLHQALKEAQRLNSIVVNFFFNRDSTAYRRIVRSTYFNDIISKIAIPLKILQDRMDDSENNPKFLLNSEDAKIVKEYSKVHDQIMAHIGFLDCMRNTFCLEAKDDFDGLLKYSDWICCLNEAHVNISSAQQSELLHRDLQTYLRHVYDSFLSNEIINFEETITSMFRTLIDWNFTASDKMSNFSKMEFIFNFSGPEIESILIAAFNTGTIDIIMNDFMEAFSCFFDQCMKFSFIECYSIIEGPISTVTLTEDTNLSAGTGKDIRRKCTMKFAEGFPVEYQIKLKNFISKTSEEDMPVIKLNCIINFLEQFHKDIAEIFKSASCEITDGGRFSLLSYMGEHGLSSKIMERIHKHFSDTMKLIFNNPDDVIKLIEKIDSVLTLYVSSGLVSDENWISSMGIDRKDRLTERMCGEILSWIVGVPESAILHHVSSYKDDILWKVDRLNIKTIVDEHKDELLPVKSRLVQCKIPVAAEKLTDYAIQLLMMHNEPELYNKVTVEKTFNAFFEMYVNIIEDNYGYRLTREFGLAASFFNSCYFLTKRIGVYLNYSFSDDRYYNFVMMYSKLRSLACCSFGHHLTGFKRELSNRLNKGNVFIENSSEYSLIKNSSLLEFYNELHGIIGSLKNSVISGVFKMVVAEIINEILSDIISTLTKMKPLADSIYYDNIVHNLNDFLSRIDEILSKYCESTKLADLCPDTVNGINQISIIMSAVQYGTDITQVSNKNLIFNNSSIKNELATLVTSIYPNDDDKAKILDHLI
ncbi:RZZ complex, subunit Zw10 family-containing protein [Strongyloides ratti]|uniref:RZZ complex, subunit Zw10 family-containing protein n=1 Tax=Strongyloides ratti TaxID=34506 RepID=A0A090MYJ2_STRRB|nr:RZZ complex, subunit Zw10 family-containing protein [Strongyloides ratti]CEF67279.1 RZZ complex, subunit Zw10 family-containing protein [Strongyloides ratti]